MAYRPPDRPPLRSMLVLSTAYVTPRGRDPFFEIIAATDRDRDAPRVVLRTRDTALYRRAVDVEGTDRRVALSTRPASAPAHWRELLDLEWL